MASFLRTLVRAIALVLAIGSSTAAAYAETPIPASPTAWVTDTAGLLTAQTVNDQNVRLRDYQRKTGHQILVYIAPTTGGVPVDDWSVRAFKHWKIGRKGLDDGLALFIFSQDRTFRIEVGYGLESKVPDVLAARILRETIAPALRAGKPDVGVTAGIDRILQLTGEAASADAPPATDVAPADTVSFSPLQIVIIVLVIVGFIFLAIRSPWMAFYLLINIFGGRGGGMSSEGGFSGGGGRSGGGGASGRW